ncbi:MAG TPA: hypothetical protein PKB07_03810, partial [Flavilitoribacter sp.]|nr:hypothetical protein [Flavilitoribacter sp.]
ANFLTAHLLMPEPSLGAFVVHSNRIFPDFHTTNIPKINGRHFATKSRSNGKLLFDTQSCH